MENEDFEGIFLFKDSKAKTVTDTIFTTVPDKEIKDDDASLVDFVNGKWMKKFLKRFISPSLLHKPVVPVSYDQIIEESTKLPKSSEGELVNLTEMNAKTAKRVTRGNRRHKRKTRKQRRIKARQQKNQPK